MYLYGFRDGWLFFWRTICGHYGVGAWLGLLVALVANDVAWHTVKGLAMIVWAAINGR